MAVVIYTGNAASGVTADRQEMYSFQKTIASTAMVAEKGNIHTHRLFKCALAE